MSLDHPVKSRSEYQIQYDAQRLREFLGVEGLASFNIVRAVEETFIPKFRKKGIVRLNLTSDDPSPGSPALVVFDPPSIGPNRNITLNIRRDVLNDANDGDGYSRFVVAHELGHIILHDHMPSLFSSTSVRLLTSYPEEETAEWQANTFAKYALVPDWLVFEHRDVASLRFACQIEEEISKDRIETVKRRNRTVWSSLIDKICPNCDRRNLYLTNSGASCYFCDHTTRI